MIICNRVVIVIVVTGAPGAFTFYKTDGRRPALPLRQRQRLESCNKYVLYYYIFYIYSLPVQYESRK